MREARRWCVATSSVTRPRASAMSPCSTSPRISTASRESSPSTASNVERLLRPDATGDRDDSDDIDDRGFSPISSTTTGAFASLIVRNSPLIQPLRYHQGAVYRWAIRLMVDFWTIQPVRFALSAYVAAL